jgi:centromere/kinetochore protein ZW10
MSTQVSAEKLGDAILQSVEHGAFPQDEHVASATVPSSALPKLLEIVSKAKEDTKVCANNYHSKFRADVCHRMKCATFLGKLPLMSTGG